MNAKSHEHKGWLEVSIDIHPDAHEALSAFLFDIGCQGVVSQSFDDKNIKAYVPFQEDFENVRNLFANFLWSLGKIFPEMPSPKVLFKKMEDQDWNSKWRLFFVPERITSKLKIFPAWEVVPDGTKGHVIKIDPGPAFGTGKHPTTRMCFEVMETLPLPDSWDMIDVGTGSGILSIYGEILGASRVEAIDIDPEAIRWAKRNVKLNNLPSIIKLSTMPLEQWTENFSMVTANISLDVILDLLPHFEKIMKQDGWLILSGILKEQSKPIEERLNRHRLEKDRILFRDEWACLVARRGNPL